MGIGEEGSSYKHHAQLGANSHCCRYKVISYPLSKPVKATPANCVQILMQAGLKNWALGKTKVCVWCDVVTM